MVGDGALQATVIILLFLGAEICTTRSRRATANCCARDGGVTVAAVGDDVATPRVVGAIDSSVFALPYKTYCGPRPVTTRSRIDRLFKISINELISLSRDS